MKTLHLTNSWHPTSGGIATFYRALLRQSEERGHFMRLVVPSDKTAVEDLGAHTRVYHLRAPYAPCNRKYRILLPHRFLFAGTAIQRILREERPDLIEVSDKYSLNYLAALARKGWIPGVADRPAVVGLSCERMDDSVAAYLTSSAAGRWFSRWYMKWLYFALFDHHITVSERTAEELRAASRGHMVRRGVWVRPMGVDVDLFTPRRRTAAFRQLLLRQAVGCEETYLLLYAGRLAAEKNLSLLIAMMEELLPDGHRDFHLLVAGDGAQRREFEQACNARLPGRTTFLGHIAGRERFADLIANVDAFVHPNPREPFGIAPLEAMASGVPLIGPANGGLTEYANDTNAWLAESRPESFAAAVMSAVSNHELRGGRIEAGRRKAEEYSWKRVGEEFLALYRELHALSVGGKREPELAPAFHSTAGNWLGMEI